MESRKEVSFISFPIFAFMAEFFLHDSKSQFPRPNSNRYGHFCSERERERAPEGPFQWLSSVFFPDLRNWEIKVEEKEKHLYSLLTAAYWDKLIQ